MQLDPIDEVVKQWRTQRPDLDPSPLAIIGRILMLFRELEQSADRALAPFELTLWQFDVLSALRRSGRPFCLTPTQLMHKITLSSGAMTNRIDRLEALGYVARDPDPDDRRGVRIRLTTEGRRVVDQAVAARIAEARAQLTCLSPKERSVLVKLLRRLLLAARCGDGDATRVRARSRRSAETNAAHTR